jgi:hypothetical protein
MVSDPTRHGVPVDVVEASTLRPGDADIVADAVATGTRVRRPVDKLLDDLLQAADVAHKEDIPRLRAAIVRYRG